MLGENHVIIPWLEKQYEKYSGSCLDLDQFPLDISETFDVLTVSSFLKCMKREDSVAFFDKCFKSLKDDGVLIAVFPFGSYEYVDGCCIYSFDMIDALISDRFVLEETYFTLDETTWTYTKVSRQDCPLKGGVCLKADFYQPTSVCCLVLKKTDKPIYGKKVDLGCGARVFELSKAPVDDGYIGVDLFPQSDVIIPQDIFCYMQRCPNNSVEHIRASHVFEHFTLDHLMPLIRECHRSLKVGGFLKVTVPDIRWAIVHYLDGSYPFKKLSIATHARRINFCDFHKIIFDEDLLVWCMKESGFTKYQTFKGDGGLSMHCQKGDGK